MTIADILRRLENLIRPGVIAEVDPEAPRCRVKTGGLLTDWLPFDVERAGQDRTWDAPSIGEQCLVFSPSGNPAIGFIVGRFNSDAHPAPDNDPARHHRRYRDGAVIEYDTASHTLRATLPAGGQAEIIATGGLHIVGPITHEGDYTQTGNQTVTGTVTVSDDVVAGEQAISLVNHRHAGVTAGPSTTGVPVP